MMILLSAFVLQASAGLLPAYNPAMAAPNTPALYRPAPTASLLGRSQQMQQFGPLQQAPPLGQAEYVEAYAAVPPPMGLKKLVKKQSVARGANIQYDKSRTPGADTMNRKEEDTSTYGRYGVASKEIPERAEGPKYGSGYGYKSFAGKGRVQEQIALDKASRVPSLDEQETPDSVIGSAIALLLGMVVGSSVTYIVARPRFQSKKMGSPEPLLTSIA